MVLLLYLLKAQDLAQEPEEQVTVVTVEDTEEVTVEQDIDLADLHIEEVVLVVVLQAQENSVVEVQVAVSEVVVEAVGLVVVEEDSVEEVVAPEEVGQDQMAAEVTSERDINSSKKILFVISSKLCTRKL